MAVNPLFAKIAAADVFTKSSFINAGKLRLKLKKVLVKTGFKGTNFIAEMEVVSALKTHDNEPNAVGTTVAFIQNFAKPFAMGNVKDFLANLLGVSEKDLTADDVAAACDESDKNPLLGAQIDCEAYPSTTKAGGPFTATKWAHVPA